MKHCSHYYTFSHLTFEFLFASFPFLDMKKKFCTFVFLQKSSNEVGAEKYSKYTFDRRCKH